MPKSPRETHFKNEFEKKKRNQLDIKSTNATLSKKQVSGNWLAFMKSNGFKSKPIDLSALEKNVLKKKERNLVPTKVIAVDCEMVSDLNDEDLLARVSLVNYRLECIYDKYVKPSSKVGDFRTRFSGIREGDLDKGADFETVRSEVRALLYNRILVGHALHNDFKVLKFGHHKQLIRDTSKYNPFKEVSGSKSPSLKKLAKIFLNENVQEGEHDSVEDARTAMKLYKKFRKEWELSLINNRSKEKPPQSLIEAMDL